MPKVIPDFLEELRWRGLIHQCTDEKGLAAHLADPDKAPRAAYIGYDPTADSLTIGNLVTIMMLVHFQRAGHQPVVLMGGGTGLIGDPSGKSAERQLLTEERVRANVESQRSIFGRIFQNAAKLDGREAAALESRGPTTSFTPPIVNNIDWLGKLGFLEALRDIGKHFSVNEMIKKDSVRMRLEQRDQGISFTEFTYQLLQSYDYFVLFRDFGKYSIPCPVTMQMGGSDQYGNIVGGSNLIGKQQKVAANRVFELWKAFYADLKDNGPADALTIATRLDLQLLSEGQVGPFAGFTTEIQELIRERGSQSQQTIVAEASYLIVKYLHDAVFGLTCPLITKADGGKFGKTESGAIWLTAPGKDESGDTLKSRTTPYAYYQFWLNASDADVSKFLRIFTLLDRPTIERIEAEHAKDPAKRHAQKELARAATLLLHGEAGLNEALGATAALFGGKRASDAGDGTGSASAGGVDLRSLSLDALTQAFAAAPTSQHARALLEAPGGLALTDLLPTTSLAKSKTEARTLLTEGSISVNGELVLKDAALARRLTPADLLHNQVITLRRGKKNWHITRWQ